MPQPFRLAVSTRFLADDFREAVAIASRLEVQGLLADARRQLRADQFSETARRHLLIELARQGQCLAGLVLPLRHRLYDLHQLDARIDALKNALSFAFQLRAPLVLTSVGGLPAEPGSPDDALLIDVLNDLARHANRVGSVLALNISHEPVERIESLLSAVTQGPIGIHFQPDELVLAGLNPLERFRQIFQHIRHVTVRDVVRDGTAGGEEVPVGRGDVGWDEMLGLLREAEYRDWLTLERRSGTDIPGDLSKAITFVRRVERGE